MGYVPSQRSTASSKMSTLYALASAAQTPLEVGRLGLSWLKGQEPSSTVLARLGLSADGAQRALGPCIWFHAATMGECAVALPVLFRCLQEYNEKVNVLLTVGSQDALKMLKGSLPPRVVVQLMPIDNPVCVSLFLRRWRPQVGVLMDTPFFPNLVLVASLYGVRLSLLNAHIPSMDMLHWHAWRGLRRLLGAVLDRFDLIVPASDVDVGRFRIFGTRMGQMPGWCSDLRHAAALGASVWHAWRPSEEDIRALKQALAGRPLWVAANTQPGEEVVVARVHARLLAGGARGACVAVVPHDSRRCPAVAEVLRAEGLRVGLWSDGLAACASADALLVDDAHALPLLYAVFGVAVVGNSLVEGCSGHNLSEAAVAGCAVVVGPHAGASLNMAEQLNGAALVAAEEATAAVRSTGPLTEGGVGAVGGAEAHGAGLGLMAALPAGEEAEGGAVEEPSIAHMRPSTALATVHVQALRGQQYEFGGGRPSAATSLWSSHAVVVEEEGEGMMQEEGEEEGGWVAPGALRVPVRTTNLFTVVHSRPSSADPLCSGLAPMLSAEHSAWSTGFSAAGDSPCSSAAEAAAGMMGGDVSDGEFASGGGLVTPFWARTPLGGATPFGRTDGHSRPLTSPASAGPRSVSAGAADTGSAAAAARAHDVSGGSATWAACSGVEAVGASSAQHTGPMFTPPSGTRTHFGSAPASHHQGASRADMWDELFAATTSSPMPWSPSAVGRIALAATSLSARTAQRSAPRLGLLSSPRASLDFSPGRLALPSSSSRSTTLSSDESAIRLGSLRTSVAAPGAHPHAAAAPTPANVLDRATACTWQDSPADGSSNRWEAVGASEEQAAGPSRPLPPLQQEQHAQCMIGSRERGALHTVVESPSCMSSAGGRGSLSGTAVGVSTEGAPLAPVQLAAAFHQAATEAAAALESESHTQHQPYAGHPRHSTTTFGPLQAHMHSYSGGSSSFGRGSFGGSSSNESLGRGSRGSGLDPQGDAEVLDHGRGLPRLSVARLSGHAALAPADSGSAASSAVYVGTAKGSLSNWLLQPNFHPTGSLGIGSMDSEGGLASARGSVEVPSSTHSSPGPHGNQYSASPSSMPVGGGMQMSRTGSAGPIRRPSRLRKASNGHIVAVGWEENALAVQTADAAVQTVDEVVVMPRAVRTAEAAVQVELMVQIMDAHTVVPVPGAQQLGVAAYHLLPRPGSTASGASTDAAQAPHASDAGAQQALVQQVPQQRPAQISQLLHLLSAPAPAVPARHNQRASSPAILNDPFPSDDTSQMPSMSGMPLLNKAASGHHQLPPAVPAGLAVGGEDVEVVAASFSAMSAGSLSRSLKADREPGAAGRAHAGTGNTSGSARPRSGQALVQSLAAAAGEEWGSHHLSVRELADALAITGADLTSAHRARSAAQGLQQDAAGAGSLRTTAAYAPSGESGPSSSDSTTDSTTVAARCTATSDLHSRAGERVGSVQSLNGLLDASARCSPSAHDREREQELAARMPCVAEAEHDVGEPAAGTHLCHSDDTSAEIASPALSGADTAANSPQAHTAASTWGSANRLQRLQLSDSGRVSFEFHQVSPPASVASHSSNHRPGVTGRHSQGDVPVEGSEPFTRPGGWSEGGRTHFSGAQLPPRSALAADLARGQDRQPAWPHLARTRTEGSNAWAAFSSGRGLGNQLPPNRRSDSGVPGSTMSGAGLAFQSSLFGPSQRNADLDRPSGLGGLELPPHAEVDEVPSPPLRRISSTNTPGGIAALPALAANAGIAAAAAAAGPTIAARPLAAQLHALAEDEDAQELGLGEWPLPSLATLPETARSSSPNALPRISISGWMARDSSSNSRELHVPGTGSHTSHSSGRTSATCMTPQPVAQSAAEAAAAADASGVAVTVPGTSEAGDAGPSPPAVNKDDAGLRIEDDAGGDQLGGWLEQQLAMAARITGLSSLPAPEAVGAAIAAAASLCAQGSNDGAEAGTEGAAAEGEEWWDESPGATGTSAVPATSTGPVAGTSPAPAAAQAVGVPISPAAQKAVQEQDAATLGLDALKPLSLSAKPTPGSNGAPGPRMRSKSDDGSTPSRSPSPTHCMAGWGPASAAKGSTMVHGPEADPNSSGQSSVQSPFANMPFPFIPSNDESPVAAMLEGDGSTLPQLPVGDRMPLQQAGGIVGAQGPISAAVGGIEEEATTAMTVTICSLSAAVLEECQAAAARSELGAQLGSKPLPWQPRLHRHGRSDSFSSAAGGSSASGSGSAVGPSPVQQSSSGGIGGRDSGDMRTVLLAPAVTPDRDTVRASPAGRSGNGSGNMRPLRTRLSAVASLGSGSGSASGAAPANASPRTPRSLSMNSSVRGGSSSVVDVPTSPHHSLSIEDLEVLARTTPGPAASVEDDESPPDTPTSRLSVVNTATSPFAHAVHDRPDPFRPSPRTSLTGSLSTLDALVALAQQPAVAYDPYAPGYMRQPTGGPEPNTPTSRMSAVNTATSPFASAVFDRPSPFHTSSSGTRPQLVAESESSPLASAMGAASSSYMNPYAGPFAPASTPHHYGASVVVASAAAAEQQQQQQHLHGAHGPNEVGGAAVQQGAASYSSSISSSSGHVSRPHQQHAAMITAALEKQAAAVHDGYLRPRAFDFHASNSSASSMAPSTAASNMTSPEPKQFLSRTGAALGSHRRSGHDSMRRSLESVSEGVVGHTPQSNGHVGRASLDSHASGSSLLPPSMQALLKNSTALLKQGENSSSGTAPTHTPPAALGAQQMQPPSTPRTLRRFLSHQEPRTSQASSASSVAAAAQYVGGCSGDEGSEGSGRGPSSPRGSGASSGRLPTRLSASSTQGGAGAGGGDGPRGPARYSTRPATAPSPSSKQAWAALGEPPETPRVTRRSGPGESPFTVHAQEMPGAWYGGGRASPLPAANTPRASRTGNSVAGSADTSKAGTPCEVPPSPRKTPRPTTSRTAVLNAALLAAAADNPFAPSSAEVPVFRGYGYAAPAVASTTSHTAAQPVADGMAGLGLSSLAPIQAPSPRAVTEPIRVADPVSDWDMAGEGEDAPMGSTGSDARVPSGSTPNKTLMPPPSPRKPTPTISPVRIVRRAAYQALGQNPDPLALLAVRNTVASVTSHIAAAAAASQNGSPSTAVSAAHAAAEHLQPLSPRSPYRQLFPMAAGPFAPDAPAPTALPGGGVAGISWPVITSATAVGGACLPAAMAGQHVPASPRAGPSSSDLGSFGHMPPPMLSQILASAAGMASPAKPGSPEHVSLAARTERVLSLQQEFSLNPHDAALVESLAQALASARNTGSPPQPSPARRSLRNSPSSEAVSPSAAAAAAAAAAAVMAAQSATATTMMNAALGSLLGPSTSYAASSSNAFASLLTAGQLPTIPDSPVQGPAVLPFDASTPLPPTMAPVVVAGAFGLELVAASPILTAHIHSTSQPSTPRDKDDGMAALMSKAGLSLPSLKLPASLRLDGARGAASARAPSAPAGPSSSGTAGASTSAAHMVPGTAPAASAAAHTVWAPVGLPQPAARPAIPTAAASNALPGSSSAPTGASSGLTGRPPRPVYSRGSSANGAADAAPTPATETEQAVNPKQQMIEVAVAAGDKAQGKVQGKEDKALLSPRAIRAELEGLRKTLQSFTFPSMPNTHHHGHHGQSGSSGGGGGPSRSSMRRGSHRSDCFDLLSGESSEASNPTSPQRLGTAPPRIQGASLTTDAQQPPPRMLVSESGKGTGMPQGPAATRPLLAQLGVAAGMPGGSLWSSSGSTVSEGRGLAAAARAAVAEAYERHPQGGVEPVGRHAARPAVAQHSGPIDSHGGVLSQGPVAVPGVAAVRLMDTADDQAVGGLPLSRSRASSFDSTRGAPRIVPPISRDTTPDQRMRTRHAGLAAGPGAMAFHAHAATGSSAPVSEAAGGVMGSDHRVSQSQLSDDWCSGYGQDEGELLLAHMLQDGPVVGMASPSRPSASTQAAAAAPGRVLHAQGGEMSQLPSPWQHADMSFSSPPPASGSSGSSALDTSVDGTGTQAATWQQAAAGTRPLMPQMHRPVTAPTAHTYTTPAAKPSVAAQGGPSYSYQHQGDAGQASEHFTLGTAMSPPSVDRSSAAAAAAAAASYATLPARAGTTGTGATEVGKDQDRKAHKGVTQMIGPQVTGGPSSSARSLTPSSAVHTSGPTTSLHTPSPLSAAPGQTTPAAGLTAVAQTSTAGARAATGVPHHTASGGALPPRSGPTPGTSHPAGLGLSKHPLGSELAAKAAQQLPRGPPSATSLMNPHNAGPSTSAQAGVSAGVPAVQRGRSGEGMQYRDERQYSGRTHTEDTRGHHSLDACAEGAAAITSPTSPALAQHGTTRGEHTPRAHFNALPAHHMPRGLAGPAVWCLPAHAADPSGSSSNIGTQAVEDALVSALTHLLSHPLEVRSRGMAAAQGAAKLASGLVNTVWHVLDDTVITPALHAYVQSQGPPS